MARHQYVILSRAKPGEEAEYRRWYAEQHLPDVCRQPGVVSGRLFDVAVQKTYDLEAPEWTLMTIYELETDDPQATMDAIRAQAGSVGMPMTASLEKAGMVQAVGREIAAAPAR